MADGCPARAALEGFAAGSLTESERTPLEDHLSTCLKCAESLEEITRSQLKELVVRPSSMGTIERNSSAALDTVMRQAMGAWQSPRLDPKQILEALDPPATAGALGVFAGYDLLETAGHGGMGVVFKARDRTLDRVVAIKVISPSGSGDGAFAERFLKEARAVAAIHHDHIVTVHHAGIDKGLAYLVMPFHAEGTLERLLARTPKLPPSDVAQLGLQLARALAATHERGILHRDIKPSNVLLEDGLRRIRLADFGLARSRGAAPTALEVIKPDQRGAQRPARILAGTPHYMSPEQARGEALDARSDLFGLGALLYQVATGHTLYPGTSSNEVLRAAAQGEHPSVRDAAPGLPAALSAIIDRLLAKHPADRFASALDAVAALEQVANPGGSRRRWIKRVVLAALAGLLLLSAVVFTLDLSGTTVVVNTLLCQRTGNTYYLRGRFGTYARLPEIVAAARPHDVIEARFSTEQIVDSFRLGGKPLTIRAARGFTPILIATNNAQPLILADAPLMLEGLTLWRRGAIMNFTALVSVENAPLHLLNCRILRSRFPGQDVVAWGRLRTVAFSESPPRQPYRVLLAFQHGSSGYLRNCLVVGYQATAIGLRASTNQATLVEAENSIFFTDRTVFMRPEEKTRVQLRFSHNVLVTGALLELDEFGPIHGITASWEDCLVDRTGGALLRLNQSYGGDLLRALDWRETNVVYAGNGTFAINRRRRTLDSASEWNAFLGLTTNSHRFIEHQAFPETCVRSSLTLSATDLDVNALHAAAFGQTPFAPSVIGEGEPWARFRREPGYRQWQDVFRAATHEWERRRAANSSVIANGSAESR